MKIGAFGLVEGSIDRVNDSIVVSPELVNSNEYGEKFDVYCCGLVLLELYSGCVNQKEEFYEAKNTKRVLEEISMLYPEESRLINYLLIEDREKKPNCMDVLNSSVYLDWKRLTKQIK